MFARRGEERGFRLAPHSRWSGEPWRPRRTPGGLIRPSGTFPRGEGRGASKDAQAAGSRPRPTFMLAWGGELGGFN